MKKKRDYISQRVKAIKPWPIMGYDLHTAKRQVSDKRHLLELLAEVNCDRVVGKK